MTSSRPALSLERSLYRSGRTCIAGIDEVGRGSWAGPVVAAAVVLPHDATCLSALDGIRDSKQLTCVARETLFTCIVDTCPLVGIGWSSHHVIDRLGIVPATRLAMTRALHHLPVWPDAVLIDAVRLPGLALPQVCLPHGESISMSIAAASIVAKVVRDRWMARCDTRYPGYGFARHKGYGTAHHRDALARLGPSAVHRRSFRPILAEDRPA